MKPSHDQVVWKEDWNPPMFSVQCPRHAARVLLGPEAVVALLSPPGGGIELHWRCPCGQTGVEVTGATVPSA